MPTTRIAKISKIVSGGQTGADRGGLDAAIHCSIPHGGWCPKGRKAEDGIILAKYLLKEHTSADYLARTEANVVDSDATIIFTMGALEGGSKKTAQFAIKHKKPYLHLDLDKIARGESVQSIIKWLQESCPSNCVLNVAGSRGSKAPALQSAVMVRMVDVISKVNGKLFYPIPEEHNAAVIEKFRQGIEMTDDELALIARKVNEAMDSKPKPPFHPKTIDEAVGIVLKELSEDTKMEIRSQRKEELVLKAHFGMGMWIRNNLIHQNVDKIDFFADFQKGCQEGKWEGCVEPDSISGVIVGLVWERLHKRP